MKSNQFYLFKDRRFLPIFLVQLCGCTNDNILKNALIILITFKLANITATPAYILIMLANVIFILPFVLFASLAGQIADRYERTIIVKIIKFSEISIIFAAAYGFFNTNLFILYSCIWFMGVHSTFFGPIKYSVLPDHMKKDELLGANGFVEAGTFLSILLGTMIGGFYNISSTIVIGLMCIIAIGGTISSFYMPKSNNSNSKIRINFNILGETKRMIKYASSKNKVYLAILGISWFWFIGAAIMAQIPSLTRDTLGADENVANLFLGVFSIGVGIGSFGCNYFFQNKITTKYVFVAALGISIFGIDLHFASHIVSIDYEPEQLKNIIQFLSRLHYWRIIFDLFMIATLGGLYVVPLFAVMQYFTSPPYRSRVIAANNLINSFFMAGSTVILSLLFYMEFTIPSVILVVSMLNLVIAIHIYKLIPNSKIVPLKVWIFFFRCFFNIFYKVEVKGLENFKKAGKRTVIISNHLSYIDPPLIACYIPETLQFAINLAITKEWWVQPFLKIIKTYPVDPTNPMAIKGLIEEVKKDRKIVIFPEGRTTTTGSMMKIYEGPGMIADKADATILPIRVDGPQYTMFSKSRKLLDGKFIFRRKLIITILPPVKIDPPKHLDNKKRRNFISRSLYDIMCEMMFESSPYRDTIFGSLINASKIHNKKSSILQDNENNSVTYRDILLKSFIFAKLLSNNSSSSNKIGLMLSNSVESFIAFFGVQAAGKVAVMIDYTDSISNIISFIKTTEVTTIYTSSKFISKDGLKSLIEKIQNVGTEIIYLEDMQKQISFSIKLEGYLGSRFPKLYYNKISNNQKHEDTAVILSAFQAEEKPKGVALSHSNIIANKFQLCTRIGFNQADKAMCVLPMFHSFGLISMLTMCLRGVRSFLYPSPQHSRFIPEVIYDIGATIMFGTDSFLANYAHYADPYDFYSLKLVISVGEKLKAETAKIWADKFGIRILEQYGTQEAATIISTNTLMHNRAHTVGRLLPNIEYHLKPIAGNSEGGRLFVRGPNISLGYIFPNHPGLIIPHIIEDLGKGWYDTGDIVSIDEDGYINANLG